MQKYGAELAGLFPFGVHRVAVGEVLRHSASLT
jgi:hypothetical protein